MFRDLRLCLAFLTAALLTPRLTGAVEVGVLPLAAPQVDASTRKMAQESLLTAMQAVLGASVEPGELKKRLGPLLRQALECSDAECWTKVGARSGVTYLVSARGFGKKTALLLTVALVRASDGKIVGRAQAPLSIDDPVALSASSEEIARKLRDSAASAAPELAPAATTSVAATPASSSSEPGGDTVINEGSSDTGGPAAPLAGMPAVTRATLKPPEWKAGFGFVEDGDVGDDSGALRLDQAVTVGELPKVKARDNTLLLMMSMPAYASDINAAAPGVLRLRIAGEAVIRLGDNALHSAPLVWSLMLPFPRVLIIGSSTSQNTRGWTQMLLPVGLSVDYRFLRLAHGFTVGAGPHASIAGGFLAINAVTQGSTSSPMIGGFSAEATYGGHLASAVRVGTWELQLRGGVERLANLVNSIGSTSAKDRTLIYGAATFLTARLTATTGDLIFGVDYRGRMTDTPDRPNTGSQVYTNFSANPNIVFGKELGIFVGGYL